MARAIWSGSISFGLLNVPVKLYSAVSQQAGQLPRAARVGRLAVRHKRVAEADGEEVPYEEIVKGYEISPEQYVVLTRDELEELDPKRTRAIEIEDFVDLDQIDPIYFDQPYYLGPRQGRRARLRPARQGDGGRAQGRDRALRAAQQRAPGGDPADGRRADAGDDALRRRGRPRPTSSTTCSPRTTTKPKQARDRDGEAADRRRSPATSTPTSTSDEYREELLALIERKAKGEDVVEAESEEPKPTKAPDLMAALEESLAAIKGEELAGAAEGDGGGEAEVARRLELKLVEVRLEPHPPRRSPARSAKSRSRSKAKAAK